VILRQRGQECKTTGDGGNKKEKYVKIKSKVVSSGLILGAVTE
jgi:hypothetical protein